MFHNAQLEPTLPTDNVTHVTLLAHHARMPLLTTVIHVLLDSSFQMETHVSTSVEVDNTRAVVLVTTALPTVLDANQTLSAHHATTPLSYKEDTAKPHVILDTLTTTLTVPSVLLDVLLAPQ